MSPFDQTQREIAARWILIDLDRWRAADDARHAAADRRTCDAIAALPTHQPTRKENDR